MAELDTNRKDQTACLTDLTTETLITLFISSKSGQGNKYKISLDISPDSSGDNWFELPNNKSGTGILTVNVVAARVRARVRQAEGESSLVNVIILAR